MIRHGVRLRVDTWFDPEPSSHSFLLPSGEDGADVREDDFQHDRHGGKLDPLVCKAIAERTRD